MAPTSDDTSAPDERKHRIPKEEYQDIKSNLCEVRKFSVTTCTFISYVCKAIGCDCASILFEKLYFRQCLKNGISKS